MDIETTARMHAHELILTQLISDFLSTVPDPREQVKHARERLTRAVDEMTFNALTLDEAARLRVRMQEGVSEILDAALQRTVVVPLRSP